MALLEKAEPIDEPGKNANLRRTLLITGRDGYTVALAVGEIDPHYEGKQVIVAYSGGDPPASMTFLRLVVPGDVHADAACAISQQSSCDIAITISAASPRPGPAHHNGNTATIDQKDFKELANSRYRERNAA